MVSTALEKVLWRYLLIGFSGLVHAEAVIVVELVDADDLLRVSGEVTLASNDRANLVSMHAKSDETGQVEFRSLTIGEWHLTSKVEDYASEHATIDIVEEKTYRSILYLRKGKQISGRISDSEGKPITQARVSVRYATAPGDSLIPTTYQWESGEVITDLQGAFEIRNVHPEKEFVVEASHEYFLPSISTPTTIGAKSRLSVNLSLQKGLPVTGTVHAVDGTPIVGVRVALLGLLSREAQRFLAFERLKESRTFTVSGENGVFRFEQVRPGEKMLVFSHSLYQEIQQYFDLPKSGQDMPIEVIIYP